MQKEGAEKRVQRVLLSTVMKSTLLLTCTRISRTIIHRSPILTMKRFTKLTSANSIISPAGLSWLTILAGDRIFYKYRIHEHQFHQLFCHILLVEPKDLQPLSLTTLLPEVKTIFQRRHFCPCPQCTTGDYHRGLYTDFLGVSQ